ncbi:MAG: hypothetical protein L0216_22060 [Planctomycetales bacterium]|nr:hypothetical protein [Planctomycetales bacterium]
MSPRSLVPGPRSLAGVASLVAALIAASAGAQEGRAPSEAARRAEFAYLARKWEEAKVQFARGNDEKVVAMANALLVLEPELPWKDEVVSLRLRAKDRMVARDVVEAAILCDSPRATVGDVIRLRVRIAARTEDPLSWVLAPEGESPGARASLTVTIREWGAGRVESLATARLPIEGLPESATLKKGEAIEGTVAVPTVAYAPLRVTARTYEFEGVVRPASLAAGTRAVFRPIVLDPVRVEVLPRGWERLAGDPVAALREAVREERPVRLLLAAALVPDGVRGEAAEALFDALGSPFEREATAPAVMAALRRLTGEALPDDRAAWLALWSRRRQAGGGG